MFTAPTVQVCRLLLRRQAGRHGQFPCSSYVLSSTPLLFLLCERNSAQRLRCISATRLRPAGVVGPVEAPPYCGSGGWLMPGGAFN